MITYAVRDEVVLNSGGPTMSVAAVVYSAQHGQELICTWSPLLGAPFTGAYQTARFNAAMVRPV